MKVQITEMKVNRERKTMSEGYISLIKEEKEAE